MVSIFQENLSKRLEPKLIILIRGSVIGLAKKMMSCLNSTYVFA